MLVPLYSGLLRPHLLCPVEFLGHSLQGGHCIAGACPEKKKEAGEGSGEKVFMTIGGKWDCLYWRRRGLVRGDLIALYDHLKGHCGKEAVGLFY